MSEKTFVILFIIITIVAVVGIGVSKFQDSMASLGSSPNPSPTLSFGTPAPTVAGQINTLSQQPSGLTPPGSSSPTPAAKTTHYNGFPTLSPQEIQNKVAVIETAKGTIAFELNPNTPEASSNFMFLAQNGFYNGLTFHRVVPGFVIQGGDPLGNGTGGPGYTFPDELSGKEQYTKGTVAMANAGPNTNGSQFFIMLDDRPDLPPHYTIFGHVISGQDVVDKIAVGDVMQKVTIEILKQ